MEVATVSDFDRLMGDSLKAIRDDHVREIEADIPAARRKIASKVRRRSFTFVLGGVAVAATATAVALFIAQSVPKIDRAEPIPPSGPPAVVARIDVPGVGAMAPGLGSLWVAHSKGLVGIDPATGAIEALPSGDPVDEIATNSEALYGVDTLERKISRIPLGTNEAATTAKALGTPALIAASDDFVWYTSFIPQNNSTAVYAVDPKGLDYRYESEFPDVVVADMAESQGRLWLSADTEGGYGTEESGYHVIEIPPADSDSEADTVIPLSGAEGSVADIVVGEGAVWVLRQATQGGGNTITRIDLVTKKVTERAVGFDDTLESIAVGEGYLWATTAPTGMNMPDDTRASLHRIDPATLEPAGEPIEVAGPGSKLAVGYGFVWVGDPNNKQVVQIDPSIEGSPSPQPSVTPDPDETEQQEFSEDKSCATFLPFVSTDDGVTVGLGSGGQKDMPLAQQNPQALVHFARPNGSFVDVIAGGRAFPPTDEERIDVMGGTGAIHQIEDGYAVTFATGGCEFQLLAYGSIVEGVKDFVQSLELRGHGGSPSDAFALWPETRPEDAYESCYTADSFRQEAESVAAVYAIDVLGWDEAVIEASSTDDDTGQADPTVEVSRDPTSSGSPRVGMLVREVAADCWSVISVGTPVEPGEPEALSVTKRGARLNVAFDLEARGLDEKAAIIRMPVEDGSVSMTADEFRSSGQQIEGVFRSLKNGPGAFLILVEDRNGQVIGAIGQALPSGDFTAG